MFLSQSETAYSKTQGGRYWTVGETCAATWSAHFSRALPRNDRREDVHTYVCVWMQVRVCVGGSLS